MRHSEQSYREESGVCGHNLIHVVFRKAVINALTICALAVLIIAPNIAIAQAPAQAPPPAADPIQQLKDLAALHDQGVITDDEFAAQKAKILG